MKKVGYENVDVWNRAVDFAVAVIDTVENISTDRRHYRLLEQIEAIYQHPYEFGRRQRPKFEEGVYSILLHWSRLSA